MRWMETHNRWLAQCLVKKFQDSSVVQLLKNSDDFIQKVCWILNQDFEREKELEKEVRNQMDELERVHGRSFDRQKMYSMLKKKLAEKKGIIL